MIPESVDHLWQSTLFAMLVAVLARLLHHSPPSTRFWLWLTASAKFLFPFSVLVAVGSHLSGGIAQSIPLPNLTPPQWDLATHVTNPVATATSTAGSAATRLDLWNLLSVIWACGFVAVATLRLTQWLNIRALVRSASPLPLNIPVSALSSDALMEPGVVGIFRPVLVLPAGLRAQLTPPQLDAIIAHELCHLRRRDNLTATLHMMVEALFWFHPLVWWIGARLVAERERACDEAVIQSGNDRAVYAEGILTVCRLYFEPKLACVSAVGGGPLNRRIEDIMTNRTPTRLHPSARLLLAGIALLAVAGPIAIGIGAPHATAQTTAASADADAAAARALRFAEQAKIFKAVPIDAKLLDRYVGQYQLSNASIFTVTRDGDRLMGQLTGQIAIEYYPYDDHEFFQPDVHAQLSFVTADGGKTSEMILHQSGYDFPLKRIDDAEAKKLADWLADKIKNKTPFPGSEAALRRIIAETMRGELKEDEMTPPLADAIRSQRAIYQKSMADAGPLESITFTGVGPAGGDIYSVKYAKATWEWRISLLPDGKISSLSGHPGP